MILASIMENGFYAHGDHILKKEDLIRRMDAPELSNSRDITFILDVNVCEVEDGFFTLLPKLKKLVINNPECSISLDSETVSQFHKNDVLLCGVFDGIAEKLASEHSLRFLHTELLLAVGGDFYSNYGCEALSLCFHDNGEAYIRLTNNSQTFGGELHFDLPEDFYRQDMESFVLECGDKYAEEIKQNKELMVLLQRAKNKGGCYIDYTKRNTEK